MAKCTCGKEFKPPGLFIGFSPPRIPIVLYHCECGKATHGAIETMAPYTADRSEKFPPQRGEYMILQDKTVKFTCPVCKGMFGIAMPVHTIDKTGLVNPSVVCPQGCGFHAFATLANWTTKS